MLLIRLVKDSTTRSHAADRNALIWRFVLGPEVCHCAAIRRRPVIEFADVDACGARSRRRSPLLCSAM